MPTDEPRPAKPLNMVLSTSPAGTLAVTVVHDDGRTVFACTSSFMTQMDMRPEVWREYLDAVQLKLDEMAGRCGWGYDERLPPCGHCERCRAAEPITVTTTTGGAP